MLVLKQMATEVLYSESRTGTTQETSRQNSPSHLHLLGFPDRELALWRNLVE